MLHDAENKNFLEKIHSTTRLSFMVFAGALFIATNTNDKYILYSVFVCIFFFLANDFKASLVIKQFENVCKLKTTKCSQPTSQVGHENDERRKRKTGNEELVTIRI